MKYTSIKLNHSTYLPGFGQASELTNVETVSALVDMASNPFVLRLKGPEGIVTVPWAAVSFAFEAETVTKLKLEGLKAVAERAKVTGTGSGFVDQPGVAARANGQQNAAQSLAADVASAAQQTQSPRAAAALRPGPPTKKGGRK